MDGEERFRALIIDRTSDFQTDNLPDHCLLSLQGRLLVSSGARSRSLHIREVSLNGDVIADHVLPTGTDGIAGSIGNSMHRRGNVVGFMSSNSPAGNGALTLTAVSAEFEFTRLAELGGEMMSNGTFPRTA